MQLNIRKIEKRLLAYRREFLRTARFLLETGLEYVDRFEGKTSLSATAVQSQAEDEPPVHPTPKKARSKKFNKDLVGGAILAQQGTVSTNKIHRRTLRHH